MTTARDIDALRCVGINDIATLRDICTRESNRQYNIEKVDHYGNTALLKACFLGRHECAIILLTFGASIYAINYFGQNALTLATYGGHMQLVMELLRRRSYHDFNLSSLVPAVCVAVLQQNTALVDYFTQLDPLGTPKLQTVHGLGINDIKLMVQLKSKLNDTQKSIFNNVN